MKHLYYFISLIILTASSSVKAQWVTDSSTRNSICTAANQQSNQRICTDGKKGAYIVWTDFRGTRTHVYGQLIDSLGNIQWGNDGMIVDDTTFGAASIPSIAPDGAYGSFLAWSVGGAADHTYAQHLDRNGKFLWKNTVRIDTIHDSRTPNIISDGHGGAIVNTYAYPGVGVHIYVQWMDSTGRSRFPQGGLQISTYNNSAHYDSRMVTDNNYNAYVMFADFDTLRLVKIDTAGHFPWGQNGKVLSRIYSNYNTNYSIAYDGNKNILLGWLEHHANNQVGLYAQRMDTSGTFPWGNNPVYVDSNPSIQHTFVTVVPDESGGAYLSYGYGNMFVQHVSSTGVIWNAPVHVDDPTEGEYYANADADGQHGLIIAWDDNRWGTSVYAQRFDINGNYLWQTEGSPVRAGAGSGGSTSGAGLLSLRNGYAITAINYNGNIYAARFTGHKNVSTGVLEVTNNIHFYPNPSTGTIFISGLSSGFTIELYNLLGEKIYSTVSENSFNQLHLNMQAKGLYLYRVTGSNGIQATGKIVIE